MSSGLMSCVRENSPPLEVEMNASGPISLPECSYNESPELLSELRSPLSHIRTASTPISNLELSLGSDRSISMDDKRRSDSLINSNSDQQKRRRFHPLRNLRRIFRRRTITTSDTAGSHLINSTDTPTNATSEKNLRSATLSSITSVVSASSPSSPLTHQQLQEAYLTQSLPKTKTSYLSLLSGSGIHGKQQRNDNSIDNIVSDNKIKSKYKQQKQQTLITRQETDDILNVTDDIIVRKHQHQQQQEQEQKQQRQHHRQKQRQDNRDMFTTSTNYHDHHHQHQLYGTEVPLLEHQTDPKDLSASGVRINQRQLSMAVPVHSGVANRNFFTERQKLRNSADSSQDLDSGNDSGTGGTSGGGGGSGGGSGGHHNFSINNERSRNGCIVTDEMSGSQRSLTEGRLIDSDFSHDGLSQSHDSVFSESATASSLSIVLKAELTDALRKRRNRTDNSEEDLGLPHSPISPQRRTQFQPVNAERKDVAKNQSEVSSLSLLSITSSGGDDVLTASTANNSISINNANNTTSEVTQEKGSRLSRSFVGPIATNDCGVLRCSSKSFNDLKDEVDLFNPDCTRLSHSAAKHKMAIRPTKKKGPSRHHRRPLENSIPEGNEELNRFGTSSHTCEKDADANADEETKSKYSSLPPNTTNNNQFDSRIESTQKICQSSKDETASINSSSSNPFGLRTLTSNNIDIKGSPQLDNNNDNCNRKVEPHRKTDTAEKGALETHESSFLRRLMQRHSKRSFSRCKDSERDNDASCVLEVKPKKVQISTSSYDTCGNDKKDVQIMNKSRSEISHENNIEETRREIKREIHHEGKIGLSAMLNNYLLPLVKESKREESKPTMNKSPQKPKSGPAARQRYVPQNISNESVNSLEKPKLTEELTVSQESILSNSVPSNETFQSTSIIKEILTHTLHSSNKADHHYEKKPKIVGLSAFQQRISRSSDTFGRGYSTNTSIVSLDRNEDEDIHYEQKQRKAVEKSKSFRTYGESKETPTSGVHNNMPSLPDLSLNVKVPFYKEFILNQKECSSPSLPDSIGSVHQSSLDFQINDNKLMKNEPRSNRSSSSYDKNIILTTGTTASNGNLSINNECTTANKLLAPSHLTSTIACNKNISEIENNIDMIVKSPFVSVLRKSVPLTERQVENAMKCYGDIKVSCDKSAKPLLNLRKEKSVSEEKLLLTSATHPVTLRDKVSSAKVRTSADLIKEFDRKSAPSIGSNIKNGKPFARRPNTIENCDLKDPGVPEFMKIQLNRVEPGRASKSNVILAKNVKGSKPLTRENSLENCNINDLSMRCLSSESVDINEMDSSERDITRCVKYCYEAVNRQAKSNSVSSQGPIKKCSPIPTKPFSPTNINNLEEVAPVKNFKILTFNNNDSASSVTSNALSLQERRRLFMMNECAQIDKNRDERKKSMQNEDVMVRKVSLKSDKKKDHYSSNNSSNNNHNSNNNNNINTNNINNNGTKDKRDIGIVIMRKKALANNTTNSQSLNGHTVTNNSNNNYNKSIKDDNTPELMKVFARRSLKIKDEDLDKILNTNTVNNNNNNNNNNNSISSVISQSVKKLHNNIIENTITMGVTGTTIAGTAPNIDSDKENISTSEEKLDKLSKLEHELCNNNVKQIINGNQNHMVMNSVYGGRETDGVIEQMVGLNPAITNSNGVKNYNTQFILNNHYTNDNNNINNCNHNHNQSTHHHNQNNNINNNNPNHNIEEAGISKTHAQFLPMLKVHNLRSISTECNNNIMNSNAKAGVIPDKCTDNNVTSMKTIERAATVGEFKGIHQRRAEWEQRVKEALK